MMKKHSYALGLALALAVALAADVRSGASRRADAAVLRQHVEVLASERLAGRLTGTEGERLAADYIVAELTKIGARPLPGANDMRLPFEFTAGVSDAGSSVAIRDATGETRRWDDPASVQALAFSDIGRVSGAVVFAGYGLSIPETAGFSYDSYATLDVKDKIVVVLRYFPEETDQQTRAGLARYASLRYKALAARDRGARALVVVTGPRSPNAGTTIPLSFDAAGSTSGFVSASVGEAVAAALFAGAGQPLADVQQRLDTGNPHVPGFELAGVELTLDVKLTRETRTAYNLAGYLPPSNGGRPAKPYVVLGAHYDHLGRGPHGSSLARKEEAGQIHHGADDNASGVAAVLGAGSELALMARQRGIILGFWSGEEIGLLGSSAFVRRAPMQADEIAAYLNFDMVGRMRDNKLTIQGLGTSNAWPDLVKQANVTVRFDVQLQKDPYLPTDLTSFYQSGVPGLNFFTGSHVDYHRPSDMPGTLNYGDLARVAHFGALVASRVASLTEPPAYAKVERTESPGGRAAMRAFTGTIPDYTSTDVKGLKLSGVLDGGPADKAGLRQGDVIVEFGTVTITNIYDYMYALEAVKVGQPVKVIYFREGERRETTLTPGVRR